MDKVRYGIIGIGNMGSTHATNICSGNIPGAELAAVCDINPERIEWAKKNLPDTVKLFGSDDDFWANADIDVLIIAVPHYFHPPFAIKAFEKGWNVISEKPAGVYTKAVKEMNEAADKSGKLFGVMFNQRTNPVYQKVKDLVDSGELGEIKRVVWIITNWYRSQGYYDSGSWRATWSGEGGGVLVNQDPHQLDLLQWMCGMPKRMRAFCYYGVNRNIEVENDVTAYFEYPNGATGLFVTSTHEAPGTNRLEISADRGKLVVEDNKITFWRNRVGEAEFNKTAAGFGQPECWKMEIPVRGENLQHTGILRNFTNALLKGEKLIAPGQEGIKGVMIANSIHLSDWTNDWVELDNIDEDLYYNLLQEKIKNSKVEKKTESKTLDTAGTY